MGTNSDGLLPDAGSSERPADFTLSLPPLEIGALLRAHGLRPQRDLGQNFLADSSILRRIVQAAELPPGAAVLEVGPGLGSLTRWLAVVARRVVAVELDAHLLPVLEDVLGGLGNVEIVQGDILQLDPATLMNEDGYFVTANIPYYITSALIRHLLEARVKPRRIVLTVQREVAERICAAPGEMSLLALSVQIYGRPRVVLRIPAGAFIPPPKVDSAVVRIDLYETLPYSEHTREGIFRMAKAGFSQKRKTLRNALAGGLQISTAESGALLERAGIDPQRRAETLTLEEWAALAQARGLD
ncbi:MAG TPA: ribosomal RNA small subunit methyltransferase A [Anaerolinea thermolimosa]|uniref:Ribosomal RNA small subunit methyltransferase A n=1 Tax=Anaerolinea thermolimosa TaxID=229919 RepID=A0A3D1JKM1_9CHLR|nr:ribosomal RNA small subunit methyltransferase A [Anaerolinea thermolimosa]